MDIGTVKGYVIWLCVTENLSLGHSRIINISSANLERNFKLKWINAIISKLQGQIQNKLKYNTDT